MFCSGRINQRQWGVLEARDTILTMPLAFTLSPFLPITFSVGEVYCLMKENKSITLYYITLPYSSPLQMNFTCISLLSRLYSTKSYFPFICAHVYPLWFSPVIIIGVHYTGVWTHFPLSYAYTVLYPYAWFLYFFQYLTSQIYLTPCTNLLLTARAYYYA